MNKTKTSTVATGKSNGPLAFTQFRNALKVPYQK